MLKNIIEILSILLKKLLIRNEIDENNLKNTKNE